ncbi:MAG: WD40/YVTN/BNR-like repeat-containing protein [Sporichthyaceae bacterium]
MSSARTLVAIGTAKGLFLAFSDDDRHNWRLEGPHFGMGEVYAAAIDTRCGETNLLAGYLNFHWGPSVVRSGDLGQTWDDTDAGAVRFPEGTGAAVERIWFLTPAPADQPGVVYAGTEPSALWRSTDNGASFTLVHGLWDHPHRKDWFPGGGGQAIHTVLPHPSDPNDLLVAMSTGGVYRSTDGGASWNPANLGITTPFLPGEEKEWGQCVHKVARHPERPDQLFAQNHGGVFRSDDHGKRWVPIHAGLPGDFGFPIVAHPNRPGSVFVYPLEADISRLPPERKARVYRTDDAGASWIDCSAGLPETPNYGSVLRDAMCADDAPSAGVYFGNRNGEVFASRDGGDNWMTLATHLPAVLCVRAAVVQ